MSDRGARRVLTVELTVEGGVLQRTLSADYIQETTTGPRLQDVGGSYSVDGRRGIEALRHVVGAGDEATVGAHLHGEQLAIAGEVLFEVLFGVKGDAEPAFLRRLFGDDTGAPNGQSLRVRIVTSTMELFALPWGITAWRRRFLRDAEWTFEVTTAVRPTEILRLRTPTSLLLILPEIDQAADKLCSKDHMQDIAEIVDEYFRGQSTTPERFVVARSRQETIRLLTEQKPSIVYYYGHGAIVPEPGLLVPEKRYQAPSGMPPWNARDIALAIRRSGAPIQIAYLNGCMTGAGGWSGVARQLLDVVPVVLAHPTTTWSLGATTTAKRWFRRLLGEEDDPVAAAFHRPADEPMTGLGWLPLLAHTRHLHFRVDRDHAGFRDPVSGIDLDRHRQRLLAAGEVRELITMRPDQRIQGFVSFGLPDNHPEDMAIQLHKYIERADTKLDLHLTDPIDVSGSLLRGASEKPRFHADMAERLSLALHRDGPVELRSVLASRAPPRTPKRRRILWLDWGVLRGLPVEADVRAWMNFCAGHLLAHQPDGVAVVVSLAIEAANKLDVVEEALDELMNEAAHRTNQIRFTVLPALGKVPLSEILQFLDEAGCPDGLRAELARLLEADTGRAYALLRQRIDEALSGGWIDLARALRVRVSGIPKDRGV